VSHVTHGGFLTRQRLEIHQIPQCPPAFQRPNLTARGTSLQQIVAGTCRQPARRRDILSPLIFQLEFKV